ncbi:MAG: zinc ABC transporter substrate-binding protein [Alphaproteobacteria bacterium]
MKAQFKKATLKSLLSLFFCCWFFLSGSLRAVFAVSESPPRVVVTLKPLHSWVAFLMQGRGYPLLLLQRKGSPHTASLNPKDVFFLKKADCVLWFGPSVEAGIAKSIQSLAPEKVITLQNEPSFGWLQIREYLNPISAKHAHHHAIGPDGHIWLDPVRAQKIVQFLTAKLVALDPKFATIYQDNLKKLEQRLINLHEELTHQLEPFKEQPFIVFHDAYQYFENRYQLKTLDVMLASPESPLKPREFGHVLGLLSKNPNLCVFLEPQFEASRLRIFLKSHKIHTGRLDPLGNQIGAGPFFYEELMRRLSKDFTKCLLKIEKKSQLP